VPDRRVPGRARRNARHRDDRAGADLEQQLARLVHLDVISERDARARRPGGSDQLPQARVDDARHRQVVHALEREHRVDGCRVEDGRDAGERVAVVPAERLLQPAHRRAARSTCKEGNLHADRP